MSETPAAPARVRLPVHLRWGDLDALGHVNNVSVLKILEEARVRAFWTGQGEHSPLATFGAEALQPDSGRATLVARQEVEYLAPIPYDQRPLDIQLWIGRLGGSSIDVCYEVHGPRDEPEPTLYARATTVVVLVDIATGRPVRITAEERSQWEPYTGDPLVLRRR